MDLDALFRMPMSRLPEEDGAPALVSGSALRAIFVPVLGR